MKNGKKDPLWKLMGTFFKSHPWHGVSIGKEAPGTVTSYIELVPSDTVKYEIDKTTGHLKVDRPQKYSNVCPTLYGFIPQTYCDEKVAEICRLRTGKSGIVGDEDPLDICVLTEKTITHGDILLQAVPIGGLRLIDGNQADDKIVAVMKDDAAYGEWRDISECPTLLIDRLKHYFLTYKDTPEASPRRCELSHVYDHKEAHEIILRSQEDYKEKYGYIKDSLNKILPS